MFLRGHFSVLCVSISRVWWLCYLTHCLSHSLQPSISELGCAKALCSLTWVSFSHEPLLLLSTPLSLSPPCLKIEKRHKAGYCRFSLGCWLLSDPLQVCLGLKTTESKEASNTGVKQRPAESHPLSEEDGWVRHTILSATAGNSGILDVVRIYCMWPVDDGERKKLVKQKK